MTVVVPGVTGLPVQNQFLQNLNQALSWGGQVSADTAVINAQRAATRQAEELARLAATQGQVIQSGVMPVAGIAPAFVPTVTGPTAVQRGIGQLAGLVQQLNPGAGQIIAPGIVHPALINNSVVTQLAAQRNLAAQQLIASGVESRGHGNGIQQISNLVNLARGTTPGLIATATPTLVPLAPVHAVGSGGLVNTLLESRAQAAALTSRLTRGAQQVVATPQLIRSGIEAPARVAPVVSSLLQRSTQAPSIATQILDTAKLTALTGRVAEMTGSLRGRV